MNSSNGPLALHCWEYGAGLGHITALSNIARRLKLLNFKNILINPEGTNFLDKGTFNFISEMPNTAQLSSSAPKSLEHIVSYNSTVKGFGFHETKFVFTRLLLWKSLLEKYRPNLVIADYAPAAVFAARSMGIPVVATGNGYTLPPVNIQAYPRFVNQVDPIPTAPLLTSINQAAKMAGMQQIDALPQIFSADIHACFTMHELDPFAKMRQPQALGPLLGKEPPSVRKRASSDAGIFFYLTHCSAVLRTNLIEALASINHAVSIYSLQTTQDDRRLAEGTKITFLEKPVPLSDICKDNKLVIHLGGHNLTMELLLAGMPQLLLPIDLEKILLAQGVENKGLAGQFRADHPKTLTQFADKIQSTLSDGTLPDSAMAFARSRKESEWHDGLDNLAEQISELLKI